jgi:hypothetical protein
MHPTLQPSTGTWQSGTIYGTNTVQDEPAILSGLFGSPDAGTAPALNEWPYGLLEALDAGTVSGWAYDPDAPQRALKVQLYVNGQWVKTVTADQLRADLAVKGVFGEAHGFSAALGNLAPGATIRAYAVDDQGQWAIPLDGKITAP